MPGATPTTEIVTATRIAMMALGVSPPPMDAPWPVIESAWSAIPGESGMKDHALHHALESLRPAPTPTEDPHPVTLAEEGNTSETSFPSVVVKVEDGKLVVCKFAMHNFGTREEPDYRPMHRRHEIIEEAVTIPARAQNEYGDLRVRYRGEVMTLPAYIDAARKRHGSALARAEIAWLEAQPLSEPVTESLRLHHREDTWMMAIPTNTSNAVTRLLADHFDNRLWRAGEPALREALGEEVSASWRDLMRFVITTNHRLALCYCAGVPVYQALMRRGEILPGLTWWGAPNAGKTTFISAIVRVEWGLGASGLGGDVELSGFRSAELAESTNLPLHLDEALSTRTSQERRRHAQSGGVTGRGRADRSIDWSRAIAPPIVTRNPPPYESAGGDEHGGNLRRTITLHSGDEDVYMITPLMPGFSAAHFPTRPGGYMALVLARPENSPTRLREWMDQQTSTDAREVVIALGAHLLGMETPGVPESHMPGPQEALMDWIITQVGLYCQRRIIHTRDGEDSVPQFPELQEMMSCLDVRDEKATSADLVVTVRVTSALVARYSAEVRKRGGETVYHSYTDLRDLSRLTGQTEEEICPMRGYSRTVGSRNQRHAVIRLPECRQETIA